MQNFKGKVCVVTGAASGIGLAVSKEIAINCGGKVAMLDINQAALDTAVEEVRDADGDVIGIRCDVGVEDDVKAAVAKTVEHYGRLDYLASNAARVSAAWTARDAKFEGIDADYIMETFRINTVGSFLMIKHCIPEMLKHSGGAIVCTSSVAARFGAAGNNIYGVTKAGLEALVRGTAALYGRQGIRCNAIEPSNTMTPAYRETIDPNLYEGMLTGVFNPHFTEGDKIASVVAFLLSDDAYTIQGATIPVDNGYHINAGMSAAVEMMMKLKKNVSVFCFYRFL